MLPPEAFVSMRSIIREQVAREFDIVVRAKVLANTVQSRETVAHSVPCRIDHDIVPTCHSVQFCLPN